MAFSGVSAAQLLMKVMSTENSKLTDRINASVFSQELQQQTSRLQNKDTDPGTALVNTASEATTNPETHTGPDTHGLNTLGRQASGQSTDAGEQKVRNQLHFKNGDAIEKIMAQLHLPAEARQTCNAAEDGQARIPYKALTSALKQNEASPGRQSTPAVPAEDVQQLLNSLCLVQSNSEATPNLSQLNSKASYTVGQLATLLDGIVQQLAKTGQSTPGQSSTLPSSGNQDAKASLPLASITVEQVQRLTDTQVPIFDADGHGVYSQSPSLNTSQGESGQGGSQVEDVAAGAVSDTGTGANELVFKTDLSLQPIADNPASMENLDMRRLAASAGQGDVLITNVQLNNSRSPASPSALQSVLPSLSGDLGAGGLLAAGKLAYSIGRNSVGEVGQAAGSASDLPRKENSVSGNQQNQVSQASDKQTPSVSDLSTSPVDVNPNLTAQAAIPAVAADTATSGTDSGGKRDAGLDPEAVVDDRFGAAEDRKTIAANGTADGGWHSGAEDAKDQNLPFNGSDKGILPQFFQAGSSTGSATFDRSQGMFTSGDLNNSASSLSTQDPQWVQEFSQKIQDLQKQDSNQITMELNQKDLGHVVLKIESKDGQVNAWVSTENQQAGHMLLQNSDTLKQHLQEQGLSLGQLFVNVKQESGGGNSAMDQQRFGTKQGGRTTKTAAVGSSVTNSVQSVYGARPGEQLISLFA